MATSIHPGLVSLLFIPSYIPSFNSKDFSFTCLLSFFAAHCILILCSEEYIAWGYLLLFTQLCLHSCVYVVLLELCYVCMPTFIATIANTYHYVQTLLMT